MNLSARGFLIWFLLPLGVMLICGGWQRWLLWSITLHVWVLNLSAATAHEVIVEHTRLALELRCVTVTGALALILALYRR